MTALPDIHRASEATRLAAAIEGAPEGLTIVGVSGPGGVGKSFLLAHVLESIGPEKLGYLVLSADASNPDTRSDFFGLVEGQLFRRNLPPPADRAIDYFPGVRETAATHRAIAEQALAELANSGAPEKVQQAAAALLRTGRILNKTIPKTRSALLDANDVTDAEVEAALDGAWDLVRSLGVMRDSPSLWGPVRDALGITRRGRIKRDLYAVTASEARADLTMALVHDPKDRRIMELKPIPGLDRLLLVIDDYEAIGGLLGDFLVGALVPELATAPFRTVLLVLGRDDLETTHPGWSQHCRRFLREQIRLTPFRREEADDLFRAAGIDPSRFAALYEATQGFPFLISLAVEEAGEAGGDSVVFLRRFYDRTTRWMTDREREWLTRICYLERVDEDTLRQMFPDENVSRIQDWFEREPSVRDPSATHFRVRPMVREKMLRYLEVRAPSRHRELVALAAGAAKGSEGLHFPSWSSARNAADRSRFRRVVWTGRRRIPPVRS